jgi:hypothetical protein
LSAGSAIGDAVNRSAARCLAVRANVDAINDGTRESRAGLGVRFCRDQYGSKRKHHDERSEVRGPNKVRCGMH